MVYCLYGRTICEILYKNLKFLRNRSLFTGRGGPEILRGTTFFWQVAEGGHLFLARKILKKPAKPIFLRISGKNKTKVGNTYFWRPRKKKSPAPNDTR